MTFDQNILNDLICIDCKNDLEYMKESNSLICKNCHKEYAIIDEILMMGGIDDIKPTTEVHQK